MFCDFLLTASWFSLWYVIVIFTGLLHFCSLSIVIDVLISIYDKMLGELK